MEETVVDWRPPPASSHRPDDPETVSPVAINLSILAASASTGGTEYTTGFDVVRRLPAPSPEPTPVQFFFVFIRQASWIMDSPGEETISCVSLSGGCSK